MPPPSEPWPLGPPGSRFEAVSRRAFLRSMAAAAAIAGLAACSGHDDAAKLGSASLAAPGGVSTSPSASSSTTTTAPSTTTTTTTTTGSSLLPATAKLVVAFSYVPSATGRVDNPYVAVWIENAGGGLVKALAVYYRSGNDARYLSELTRWASTRGAGQALAAVSSATRAPGAYSLVWDGTDLSGARASIANYFVCIEAAREHGPYSLIRQSVTLATQPGTTSLKTTGELTGATADYRTA